MGVMWWLIGTGVVLGLLWAAFMVYATMKMKN